MVGESGGGKREAGSVGERSSLVPLPASPLPDSAATCAISFRTAATYSLAGIIFRTAMEKSQYEHRRWQNGMWRYRCTGGNYRGRGSGVRDRRQSPWT